MRHSRAQILPVQRKLFQSQQPEPDWQALAEPVRRQAVRLIAQLFCEHQQCRGRATGRNKEVGDE